MKVGIVLSGLAPGDVDPLLLEAADALSTAHDVTVWAPPGSRAHLRRRLPASVTVHHADAVEARSAARRLRPRRPRALRRDGIPGPRLDAVLRGVDAQLVIVPTSSDAQRARRELSDEISVIAWSPAGVRPTEPRSTQDRPRRVLAVGDLVGSSRFGDAIRAFDAATMPGDGWTLAVRGSGRHAGGLADLVAWRGLEERVDVSALGTWGDALDATGILVATSPHASPGLQALDAAAAGVPVVGFDDDPVACAVAAAGGGHVVPAGSVNALGAVLGQLVEDADARARCAQRGVEFAAEIAGNGGAEHWVGLVDAIGADHERRRERRAPAARANGSGGGARSRQEARDVAALTATVEAALNQAGISHARIGAATGDEAVVVAAEDRTAVLQALLSQEAGAVGGLQAFARGDVADATLARTVDELPLFVGVVDQLRAYAPEVNADVHVDVELWAVGSDGARHAPRPNRETATVGPSAWSEWMARGSGTVSGLPLWDEVTFPIDAVFTWVDGADERWRLKRDDHLDRPATGTERDGASEERFLSRDEIYFAVAAARRHLPWLRRIIIVTDEQRHERIASDFPEVEFVDHREIFPDASVLPVFNSHAIEACLHRIPGLAEHFVYFNDDMIVACPLAPTDFFGANGVATFFPSPLTIGFHDGPEAEPHLLAAANNRELLARDFGVEIAHSMLHIPYAHTRSVLAEMEERYADEFQRTRASRFRAGEDVSVLSSFAQHYGWLTQRYQPGSLEYRFVRLEERGLGPRLEAVLADHTAQVVALGEPLPGQARHPDEERLVREFLEALTS